MQNFVIRILRHERRNARAGQGVTRVGDGSTGCGRPPPGRSEANALKRSGMFARPGGGWHARPLVARSVIGIKVFRQLSGAFVTAALFRA